MTQVEGLDYRSITTEAGGEEKKLKTVEEGGQIPETTIKVQANLVKLRKRGRMLVASYEAVRCIGGAEKFLHYVAARPFHLDVKSLELALKGIQSLQACEVVRLALLADRELDGRAIKSLAEKLSHDELEELRKSYPAAGWAGTATKENS